MAATWWRRNISSYISSFRVLTSQILFFSLSLVFKLPRTGFWHGLGDRSLYYTFNGLTVVTSQQRVLCLADFLFHRVRFFSILNRYSITKLSQHSGAILWNRRVLRRDAEAREREIPWKGTWYACYRRLSICMYPRRTLYQLASS